MFDCTTTWTADDVTVVLLVLLVVGVAVIPRLASHDCTVLLVSAWATATADPLVALMAAQPTSVAASEAEVSKTLTLLMAAARRLPVRVSFMSVTILSGSTST